MKEISKYALAFLLAASLILSGCSSAKTDESHKKKIDKSDIAKMSNEEVYKIAEEAYIFASPLIILHLFEVMTTNTVEPTSEGAPINQLFSAKTLANPQTANLTRPNADTVYTQAYLDLSKEAWILEKPATDRFCAIQVFDGYSNSPNILGTGFSGGNNAVSYVFTGPKFKGTIPEGLIHIAMPTDLAWLLIRIKCDGDDDLKNVYAIQNGFKLKPLSYYGKNYTPPKGTYKKENHFDPLQKFNDMSIPEYFELFNKLSIDNPPAKEDAPAMMQFAKIGIGPGLKFDWDDFTKEQQKMMEGINKKFVTQIVPNEAKIHVENGWVFMDNTVGIFGTDYRFRASVAYNGFANPVSMAVYPSMVFGPDGKPLSGMNKYVLTFPKGQLPPHGEFGFWSITVYNLKSGRMIENPLHRYNLNSGSKFVYNPDGSLSIYLQSENPGKDKESNWLPIDTGDFTITMRIYRPDKSVLDGRWLPPALQMVK